MRADTKRRGGFAGAMGLAVLLLVVAFLACLALAATYVSAAVLVYLAMALSGDPARLLPYFTCPFDGGCAAPGETSQTAVWIVAGTLLFLKAVVGPVVAITRGGKARRTDAG